MKDSLDTNIISAFLGARNQLTEIVSSKLNEAKLNGKNLLILVGEEHGYEETFIYKSLLAKVAHDTGIKNVIFEAAPSDAPFLSKADINENQYIMKHFMCTKFFKFSPIYADLDIELTEENIKYLTSPEGIDKREKNMIDIIYNSANSAMFETGCYHVAALANSPLIKEKFNTLEILIDYYPAPSHKNDLELSRDAYLTNNKNAIHLATPEILSGKNNWKLLSYILSGDELSDFTKLAKDSGNIHKDFDLSLEIKRENSNLRD